MRCLLGFAVDFLIAQPAHHFFELTLDLGVEIAHARQLGLPLLGRQPPDAHIWIVKSEAPTFVEFEGPLSQDTPVWRIELMTPEPDPPNAKTN